MEFKKNLLRKEKKSYFRFAMGIVFFIISILWISVKISDEQKISFFDWLYFGLFTLNGIAHSMGGFGFQFEELFGKAFIVINEEIISIKTKVLDKEQNILWSDIQNINYNLNKLYIHKTDNTTQTFNLSEIDYDSKNEIKESIKSIANKKQIITAF